MGPVLEDLTVGRGLREQLAEMRSEPGEQRHLLAPDEDVDRVDLDDADLGEHAAEVAAIDASGRRGSARPWAAIASRRACSIQRRRRRGTARTERRRPTAGVSRPR